MREIFLVAITSEVSRSSYPDCAARTNLIAERWEPCLTQAANSPDIPQIGRLAPEKLLLGLPLVNWNACLAADANCKELLGPSPEAVNSRFKRDTELKSEGLQGRMNRHFPDAGSWTAIMRRSAV